MAPITEGMTAQTITLGAFLAKVDAFCGDVQEMAGELIALRTALAEAQADSERLTEWVSHLSWCATCAQDGLADCDTGKEIRAFLDASRQPDPAPGGTENG